MDRSCRPFGAEADDRTERETQHGDTCARRREPAFPEAEPGESDDHAADGDELGPLLQVAEPCKPDLVGHGCTAELLELLPRENGGGIDAALDCDESFRNGGMELGAGVSLDLLQCGGVRETRSVRAVRCHRVVAVGDDQKVRCERESSPPTP